MNYNPYSMPYGFQNQSQSVNLQRIEIIHVNGENGARAFQMAPNSNALLLDDTAPIVWLVQTDGAGYKTTTPYDISPHVNQEQTQMKSLEERINRLEEMLSGKSNESIIEQK